MFRAGGPTRAKLPSSCGQPFRLWAQSLPCTRSLRVRAGAWHNFSSWVSISTLVSSGCSVFIVPYASLALI